VISKIIASKLELLIPKIIFKEQGVFVKGRNIMDCIGTTFEMTQCINKGDREKNIILNLDMSKAFDKVD
jgi:c-di-AMP phosphodiesterase-like protein